MLTFDPKSPATDREVSMHIWIDIWHIARSSLQYCTSPTSYSSHSPTLPCEVLCTTTFACTIGPKCAAKFGQTLPWHAPYAKHFGCQCECECSMWGVSASVPLTRLSSPSSRAKQPNSQRSVLSIMQSSYHQLQLRPGPSPSPSPGERATIVQIFNLCFCLSWWPHPPGSRQAGRLAVDTNRFVY